MGLLVALRILCGVEYDIRQEPAVRAERQLEIAPGEAFGLGARVEKQAGVRRDGMLAEEDLHLRVVTGGAGVIEQLTAHGLTTSGLGTGTIHWPPPSA